MRCGSPPGAHLRLGSKAPVIAGMSVNVEVERAGYEQGTPRPQHAQFRRSRAQNRGTCSNVFMATTVPTDAAASGKCSTSPIRSTPWPARRSSPTYFLPGNSGRRFATPLSRHLKRPDFQDRFGQVECLGNRAGHAMHESVHDELSLARCLRINRVSERCNGHCRSSSMSLSCPGKTSRDRSEDSGSR